MPVTTTQRLHKARDGVWAFFIGFLLQSRAALSMAVSRASRIGMSVGLGVVFCIALIGAPASNAQAAKYAAIVIEESTGKVLFSRNADNLRYPASLTKIMTLYLLFEELDSGRLTLKSRMKASRVAASRSPSKLYLKPGQTISVEDAILALVTKSANDVATIVAEHLSGDEPAFAKRMTRKARAIGMKSTTFRNASGLPHSKQRTTARDMARLGIALRRDFPKHYHYFKTRNFKWKGRNFGNHNKLLSSYSGTDGIKTGYINASGFNLMASVKRHNTRLIGVVFGGKTGRSRDAHMKQILDASFKRVKPTEIRTQLTASAKPKKKKPTIVPFPSSLPSAPPKKRVRSNLELASSSIENDYLDSPPDPTAAQKRTIWSVQIGSFAKRANAHRAAVRARRTADDVLGMTPARLTLVTRGEMPLWRVRFHNLDEIQARSACAALFADGSPCFAVQETIKRAG